jgi:tRNA(adenine34) deaminase
MDDGELLGEASASAEQGDYSRGWRAVPTVDRIAADSLDLHMMERCVELSRMAGKLGELPFAAVICRDGHIVSEATNRVNRDRDVTRHAELLAVSDAQKVLGKNDLSDCVLYSNVEPCAMCSFPIRETRIRKVVYAIRSPLMGGFSKFSVLKDDQMSDVMPEFFGDAPEVIGGLLSREAAKVWRNWNPVIWGVIRFRGCFGGDPSEAVAHFSAARHRRTFDWRRVVQMMTRKR